MKINYKKCNGKLYSRASFIIDTIVSSLFMAAAIASIYVTSIESIAS